MTPYLLEDVLILSVVCPWPEIIGVPTPAPQWKKT